jgi:hypothetical protein
MTANYTDLIARLKDKQAALGDGRDKRSENEKADWYAATRTTQGAISGLMYDPKDLAREGANLVDLAQRKAVVAAKQQEIETEIANFTDWRLVADARQRDCEYERQRDLRRRLQRLLNGSLYREPGQTYEPLEYLDQRIHDVEQRIARLRDSLAGHLATAERLLGAPVTIESPSPEGEGFCASRRLKPTKARRAR